MKIVMLMLLILGGDAFDAGMQAYREGRFQEALEAFSEAEQAAGITASAELLYNRALAALRAGDLTVAEYSAEKAAVRGGAEFVPLRDFLLGCAAFMRCEQAEALTDGPDTKASDFDEAIVHATVAGRFWQRAAASRDDWPEARRNAERALRKLEALKKKKKESARQRDRKKEEEKTEHQVDPLAQTTPGGRPQVTQAAPQLDELSSDRIKELLRKLARKEKEKLALRRARQKQDRATVEKDW